MLGHWATEGQEDKAGFTLCSKSQALNRMVHTPEDRASHHWV